MHSIAPTSPELRTSSPSCGVCHRQARPGSETASRLRPQCLRGCHHHVIPNVSVGAALALLSRAPALSHVAPALSHVHVPSHALVRVLSLFLVLSRALFPSLALYHVPSLFLYHDSHVLFRGLSPCPCLDLCGARDLSRVCDVLSLSLLLVSEKY